MLKPAALIVFDGQTHEIFSAEIAYALGSDDPEKHTPEFIAFAILVDSFQIHDPLGVLP
jgi:hypothetical protein